jgi:hypothetical protein
MKKFLLILSSIILFSSCTKEVIKSDVSNFQKGGFAIFEKNPIVTAGLSGGKYKATIVDANSNAVEYRIISVGAKIAGVAYPAEIVDYKYSFPANVDLSLNTLAALFGLTAADITYGDSFTLIAEVKRADGTIFRGVAPSTTGLNPNGNNTMNQLLSAGSNFKSAMNFTFTVACPSFDRNAMIGTYLRTNDPFDFVVDPFQVIAGPNANELILVNWTGEGKNCTLVVNPDSQAVSVAKQGAWTHPTFGLASVEGDGLAFSCVGLLNLNLAHTVSAGSFGKFPLSLQKQ